jgi:hypothetical protein
MQHCLKCDTSVTQGYMEARSIVTSRDFLVDADLGEGLVPLADLFNHRTGVTQW